MSSVSTRSPTTRRRRDVCHCTTRELHRGSQPLDVCQPSQVERGWNVAALGRVTSWSGSTGKRWSVLAAWDWNGRGEWPSPSVGPTLCLDKHVAIVCATCFYWLRQLRWVRRSLDAESAATLVHAFVTSRVDYCNAILGGASKSTTDKLQRVLNTAARVVSNTRKYNHGSAISCTTSCTDLTFLSGCSANCVQRSIDVCSTKHECLEVITRLPAKSVNGV